MNISLALLYMSCDVGELNTVETAYKVAICPRGNLFYMRIYLITDLELIRGDDCTPGRGIRDMMRPEAGL